MDAMDAEAGFAEMKQRCVARAQEMLGGYEAAADGDGALGAVSLSLAEARARLIESHATLIAASIFLGRVVGDVEDNPFKQAAEEATANFLTAAEMLEATRLAVARAV